MTDVWSTRRVFTTTTIQTIVRLQLSSVQCIGKQIEQTLCINKKATTTAITKYPPNDKNNTSKYYLYDENQLINDSHTGRNTVSPSGLAHQSLTPFTGPDLRSLSDGLMPPESRCSPVQFLSRHAPSAFTHLTRPNMSPTLATSLASGSVRPFSQAETPSF